MSGGGIPGGGKRGRRSMVTNVNLVPFIDLFSTLIIFLLSTAVWDQLASIEMSLGAQDKATVEAPKEELKKVTSNVKITVSDSYIEVFEEGKSEKVERPKDSKDDFDYALVDRFLDGIRQRYPEKRDMLVFATDASAYKDLVGVLDRALARKFEELIVTGLEQQM
jgi:biopolymer transport protein ExbD